MSGFFFAVRCGSCVLLMSRVAVASLTMGGIGMTMGGSVLFMKLLGAVRTIEIMAFAGNGKDGSGHE